MGLILSSEKLSNSLLRELLKKLAESFGRMNRDFYVIGATARDIILQQLAGTSSGRKTRDLDIAIAIPDWDAFDQVRDTLIAEGFIKDPQQYQRFYYKYYELDIVPYGAIAKENDYIYWPPEEDIAMSVKGFDEVLSEAITVSVDNEFNIKVASLHGLFLLKFNAWLDRNISTSKDADDISIILNHYFFANLDRDIHPEVYDWENFDEYIAGGYWLAHDLCSLLNKSQIDHYNDCVKKELEMAENSVLINQIIENSYSLTYEQVRETLQVMSNVFQQY